MGKPVTKEEVISAAKGEVIEDSQVHKFFAVATVLDLSKMEFVEGSKDWSMRLMMDGQTTNFSLSMTRKAANKPFSHWLAQEAVPVLVRHVENANYDPDNEDSPQYWVNLIILPSMPNKKLLKKLKEALELSEQHVRKARPKASVALAAAAQEQ